MIINVILFSLISILKFHPKADKLRELTLSSDNGLIELSPKMYKEYVMTHPRPYDIVVLYTHKNRCYLCNIVFNQFIQVADSFRDANGYKPDMISRKRAVFFAVFYYSKNNAQIFVDLDFNKTKANILYTTPHNIQYNKLGQAYIKYDEDYVIKYTRNSKKIYALKMMEFANAKSQRQIPLKKNPIVFIYYFLVFIAIIIVLLSNKETFLSPQFWLSGSLLITIVCVSGIVYNILHGTPFAKYDKSGAIVELIRPGKRYQYMGEGIAMSSLFVLGGSVLYSLVWINQLQDNLYKKMLVYAAIAFVILDMKIITFIFSMKMGNYNPTFFPPKKYFKGGINEEQGNSF